VQSPQPKNSKPPVKMEQRGRTVSSSNPLIAIGCANGIRSILDFADEGQGVTLPWREHDHPQKEQTNEGILRSLCLDL
jgi:hypothetical protein